jgi:hypothetical protein
VLATAFSSTCSTTQTSLIFNILETFMTTTTKPLSASARQLADLCATDTATIGALLKHGKVQPGAGGKYDLRDALAAIWGDPAGYHPMGRQQLARAEMIEMKNAQRRREVVEWAEVESIVSRVVAESRMALVQVPGILEAMGLDAQMAARADRHCASAIKTLELMVNMFDPRLNLATSASADYREAREKDLKRFLEYLGLPKEKTP